MESQNTTAVNTRNRRNKEKKKYECLKSKKYQDRMSICIHNYLNCVFRGRDNKIGRHLVRAKYSLDVMSCRPPRMG